jgi:hypothetical protein
LATRTAQGASAGVDLTCTKQGESAMDDIRRKALHVLADMNDAIVKGLESLIEEEENAINVGKGDREALDYMRSALEDLELGGGQMREAGKPYEEAPSEPARPFTMNRRV